MRRPVAEHGLVRLAGLGEVAVDRQAGAAGEYRRVGVDAAGDAVAGGPVAGGLAAFGAGAAGAAAVTHRGRPLPQ